MAANCAKLLYDNLEGVRLNAKFWRGSFAKHKSRSFAHATQTSITVFMYVYFFSKPNETQRIGKLFFYDKLRCGKKGGSKKTKRSVHTRGIPLPSSSTTRDCSSFIQYKDIIN